MEQKLLLINKILWDVSTHRKTQIEPLCPTHRLRMKPYPNDYNEYCTNKLKCAECEGFYSLPRFIYEEKEYIIDKIDSKKFKQMKILNLDDEAIPIAEDKVYSKNNKFFVTAVLTESKIGQRLVVYAGEKGKKEKTQIFVEPEIKRLAFDQKDLHPTDIFLKLEGTFKDGTQISIEKLDK